MLPADFYASLPGPPDDDDPRCDRCDGNGYLIKTRWFAADDGEDEQVDCWACGGDGHA